MSADTAADAARALLSELTPLKKDCGRLCGAACCHPDADGKGGMLLYPGEAEHYAINAPWARLTPGELNVRGAPLTLLTCEGTCERDNRPLACRMFPLVPVAEGDTVRVIPDPRAWPVCPLMAYGTEGLQRAFAQAVLQAAERLWASPDCRAFLRAQTALLQKFTHF